MEAAPVCVQTCAQGQHESLAGEAWPLQGVGLGVPALELRVDGNGARKMLAQDERRSAVQFYSRVTLRRDLKTSRAAAVRPRT